MTTAREEKMAAQVESLQSENTIIKEQNAYITKMLSAVVEKVGAEIKEDVNDEDIQEEDDPPPTDQDDEDEDSPKPPPAPSPPEKKKIPTLKERLEKKKKKKKRAP